MTDMITTDLVRLDARLGADKHEVIRALAGVVERRRPSRRTSTSSSPTRWPARRPRPPACPAASRSRTAAPPGVDEPTLAFARLSPGVDFGAKDGPADIAFLIAAPAGGDATHLQLLTKLARSLVKAEFTERAARGRDRGRGGRAGASRRSARHPRRSAAAAARRPPQRRGDRRQRLRRRRLRRRPHPARAVRAEGPRRRHRVPDRHRAHLHGRRGARAGGRAGRRRDPRRDPGLGRLHAAGPRHDRQRRGGDLRGRRRACATGPASPASRWSPPA